MKTIISVVLTLLAWLSFAGAGHAQSVNLETLEPESPTTAPAKPSPSLQMVKDDPALPRVLLIGDSISMGYTLRVREQLKGKANVHRPLTNCGATSRAIPLLDGWLATENTGGRPAKKWDVIHFNFGLHDLKYVDDKGRTVAPAVGHQNVPPAAYEKNLHELVARLKATGATLVWASTTPVPDGLPGHFPKEVTRYNEIAAKVMREEGIATDDLYAVVKPRLAELQLEANVHFHGSGSTVLAEQVSASIERALAGRRAPATTSPTTKVAHAKASAASAPKITLVEPRVWGCDFVSEALARPMRFLVVLPEGATRESAPLPVIYFLHGRGRHERTLLEQDGTRPRVLASPCAVVLPKGREGWYVNSPVIPEDRYADYVDEVITLAEKHFPVGRTPAMRAIGGWSMGGYGAAYTACRRAGDFAAVAPVIGILDFPRPQIAEHGQNYTVPDRFGHDVDRWNELNPRRLIAQLRGTPVFVAYADRAPERQMNEAFIADARANGVAIDVLRMSGGHTFSMVEQGLPPAFSFMEKALKRGGGGTDGHDHTVSR